MLLEGHTKGDRVLLRWKQHKTPVREATWAAKHENIFSTADEAGWMRTWDLRDPFNPVVAVRAHLDPLESLAYHPYDEFCLATSSCDNTAVVRVDWSPNHPSVLVTSAEDHRLMLWDVKRIGEEQSAEDAEDGPPELLFIHGGHWDIVHDFSWDATTNLITSVGEDHTVQIWRMAEHIECTIRDSSIASPSGCNHGEQGSP
ncbi:probable histone-binding protein lin-53 [Selaginella moellendorffii]|uniref:probable histone-binding protein lin-53 n=1 Tax=Selaginella moellendorffii TaxID=88036 RepID=UPI000D1CC096|nr:probable histone-binding protein lin-53 [Selaginella moellendorffii]|eukprot:XP_024521375.1 probable histone-binding protein lin-53 [Selaginella moellendorffii]